MDERSGWMTLVHTPESGATDSTGADRRATWLELFFDLVFAAAVSEVGSSLAGDYRSGRLVGVGLPFFLFWWAWVGHTLFSTRFDTDDTPHRILTLGQMFAVAVMAVNADAGLASRDAAGFAAAYAVVRLLLLVQYLRAGRVPQARPFAMRYAIGIGAASTVWLGSAIVAPPYRYGLWGLALAIELMTPLVTLRHSITHPPDPAHLPERFGLFTLILIGQSVVSIMAGMKRQETWTAVAAGSAVLGLGLAFVLWWCYFVVLAAASPRSFHFRKRPVLARVWGALHLPLCLGIAVASAGIERVVATGSLTGEVAWLLFGSVMLVILSLTGIGVTGEPPRGHGSPALAEPS